VHDFDQDVDDSNWSLCSEETICTGFVLEQEFAEIGISFAMDCSAVPLTVGPRQKPPGEVRYYTRNKYGTELVMYVRCCDTVNHIISR